MFYILPKLLFSLLSVDVTDGLFVCGQPGSHRLQAKLIELGHQKSGTDYNFGDVGGG